MSCEYLRVKTQLLNDISKQVYKAGNRLPAEREMCSIFGVSRITVRQALTELELDGWVKRIQGKGTFVQSPQQSKMRKFEQVLSSNYSFSEELLKNGITPSSRVLSLMHIPAQQPLVSIMNVEEGHMIDVVLRIRLADDVPYAYETSYVLSEYLDGASADEIAQNGLYNTMEKHGGIRPDKAVEVLEAAIAPEVVAQALGRQGILSVMQIERTAYFRDKIVEYCTSSVAGDKYRFRVKLE